MRCIKVRHIILIDIKHQNKGLCHPEPNIICITLFIITKTMLSASYFDKFLVTMNIYLMDTLAPFYVPLCLSK